MQLSLELLNGSQREVVGDRQQPVRISTAYVVGEQELGVVGELRTLPNRPLGSSLVHAFDAFSVLLEKRVLFFVRPVMVLHEDMLVDQRQEIVWPPNEESTVLQSVELIEFVFVQHDLERLSLEELGHLVKFRMMSAEKLLVWW